MEAAPEHHGHDLTWTPGEDETRQRVEAFITQEDPGWVDAALARDPALTGKPDAKDELKLYQGLHAIAWHQKAHALYEEGTAESLLEARSISQGVRRITAGIEIHPGATIGKNFFVDHGAGVVIGETCHIGDDVFLYHDVTLGAVSGLVDQAGRRHPTIGNEVTLSAGSKVLGPANLGIGTTVGANALLSGNITIGDATEKKETGQWADSTKIASGVIIDAGRNALRIGKNVRIGTSAHIKGNVTIEDGARIGDGVTIIGENIVIGKDAVIAPGEVIQRSVLPGQTVIGSVPGWVGLLHREESPFRKQHFRNGRDVEPRQFDIGAPIYAANAALKQGVSSVSSGIGSIIGINLQQSRDLGQAISDLLQMTDSRGPGRNSPAPATGR